MYTPGCKEVQQSIETLSQGEIEKAIREFTQNKTREAEHNPNMNLSDFTETKSEMNTTVSIKRSAIKVKVPEESVFELIIVDE